MNNIKGIDAIRMAQEISKIPDGTFNLAFYKYNRATDEASAQLTQMKECKTRAQLPQEKWEVNGDAYFLFEDTAGKPKTVHRVLVRFIAFPPDFIPRKIEWLK